MHHTSLIAILVAGFVLAFIFGALAQKLRLSPLVGYLLAGVVAGPFTPGFVGDQTLAPQLAEIGVILLMFGVGLHFSMRDLLDVQGHRPARRGGADRAGHRAGLGPGAAAGLVARRGPGVRPVAVGRQYRGAAARAGGTAPGRDRARPHRGGLADRRGPGDGAGAGAAAGAGGPARRRRQAKAAPPKCGKRCSRPSPRSAHSSL